VNKDLLFLGYERLITQKFDTVFPVLPYSFPIQRALKKTADNQVALFAPEFIHHRSQDLEKAFHDAGQFYWFHIETLLKNRKLWTDNTGCIMLSEMQAHDIDTEEDWEIAAFKYQLRHGDS
jgi:N-acylneuraminate cytidylyltransferase